MRSPAHMLRIDVGEVQLQSKLCIQIDTDNCTSSPFIPFYVPISSSHPLRNSTIPMQINSCIQWNVVRCEAWFHQKNVPGKISYMQAGGEVKMTDERQCETGINFPRFKIIFSTSSFFFSAFSSTTELLLFSHSFIINLIREYERWRKKVRWNDQPFFTHFICRLRSFLRHQQWKVSPPAWLEQKSKKTFRDLASLIAAHDKKLLLQQLS